MKRLLILMCFTFTLNAQKVDREYVEYTYFVSL